VRSSGERFIPRRTSGSTERPVISWAPATLTPGEPFVIQGANFADFLGRSGGGFQASPAIAPVVSIMSLVNEQMGRVAFSGRALWSATTIAAEMGHDMPPGPALLIVRTPGAQLVSTVVCIRD
jgi:hypothetical protein